MAWQDEINPILNDRRSGASTLSRATARVLLGISSEVACNSVAELLGLIQEVATGILHAQNGMSSLVGLFNRVCFAVGAEREVDAAAMILRETLKTFLAEQERAQGEIARRAVSLMPHGVTIATYSASSTVLATLRLAAQTGRNPLIICHECRPTFEGHDLASDLARANVPTTLTVDAAMFDNVRNSELVIVGADSLSEQGVVGKIGTAVLTVCAQWHGIPCYALADTNKIWPSALGIQPIRERPHKEIWDSPPEGVQVSNLYYDLAPWSAISGVVTEQGLLSSNEIKDLSHQRTIHPAIREIIDKLR
jgi:translation initiation factor 2B subunit (eIF-2B alpha/beta/delta family)